MITGCIDNQNLLRGMCMCINHCEKCGNELHSKQCQDLKYKNGEMYSKMYITIKN